MSCTCCSCFLGIGSTNASLDALAAVVASLFLWVLADGSSRTFSGPGRSPERTTTSVSVWVEPQRPIAKAERWGKKGNEREESNGRKGKEKGPAALDKRGLGAVSWKASVHSPQFIQFVTLIQRFAAPSSPNSIQRLFKQAKVVVNVNCGRRFPTPQGRKKKEKGKEGR